MGLAQVKNRCHNRRQPVLPDMPGALRRPLVPLIAVLLMGSGPCSSDDPTQVDATPAVDAPVDGSDSSACPNGPYESITDTMARWQGNWLVDDAATNTSCPNAVMITLEPWTFNPLQIPADPDERAGCPHAFFSIRPTSVQACDTTEACIDELNGRGFYVEAWPVNPPAGFIPTAHVLLQYQGTWMKDQGTGYLIAINHLDPNVLDYLDKHFDRTGQVAGTCKNF